MVPVAFSESPSSRKKIAPFSFLPGFYFLPFLEAGVPGKGPTQYLSPSGRPLSQNVRPHKRPLDLFKLSAVFPHPPPPPLPLRDRSPSPGLSPYESLHCDFSTTSTDPPSLRLFKSRLSWILRYRVFANPCVPLQPAEAVRRTFGFVQGRSGG